MAVAAARPAGRVLLEQRRQLRRAQLRPRDPAARHAGAVVVVPAGAVRAGLVRHRPARLAGLGDRHPACVAGLLPWFYYAIKDGRTMFSFYVLPALPFLILAVVYVLGAIMTPPGGHGDREGTIGPAADRHGGGRRLRRCWWRSASPTSIRSSWASCSPTRAGPTADVAGRAAGSETNEGRVRARRPFCAGRTLHRRTNRARPDRLPRGKRAIGARKEKLNDLRCRTQRVRHANFQISIKPVCQIGHMPLYTFNRINRLVNAIQLLRGKSSRECDRKQLGELA